MKRQHKVLTIGVAVLMLQLLIFWDNLSPILWGQIKVSPLACTCPDMKVENGKYYLRSITPELYKAEGLDYSEVYLDWDFPEALDPLYHGQYLIKGEVIGRDKVYEGSLMWHPRIKVNEWKYINPLADYLVKILFIFQVVIFLSWMRSRTKK